MSRPRSTAPRCTRCGGTLRRVHRSSDEARESSDFRRYRCTEAGCDWDGLLPRSPRRSRGATATAPADGLLQLMPSRLWLVMGALLVMLVAGAFTLFKMAFQEDRGALATGGMPLNTGTSSTPAPAPALQPRK